MIATGLLETVAALLIEAMALAALLAGIQTAVAVHARSLSLQSVAFGRRQIESLVENAATQASAVSSVSTDAVTFTFDRPGSGSGFRHAVTIALAGRGARRLVHRIGAQTMVLERDLPRTSGLRTLDGEGRSPAPPSTTFLIELDLGSGPWWFATAPAAW